MTTSVRITGVILATLLACNLHAEDKARVSVISSQKPAGTIDLSLLNEVNAAVDRGLDWLAANQKPDGSFSNGDFPALTALAMDAFIRSKHPQRKQVLDKGLAYLLSCRQPDGGIYRKLENRKGGGLSNYNTAICMTTIHAMGDRALAPVILKAREFVSKSQHFGEDVSNGGFGYDRDNKRAYTDLLNTYYSVQAMRLTQDAEDLRPGTEQRSDIDWKAVIEYIEKMHNKAVSGEANTGGFFYRPGESKAGSFTNEQGVIVFRSFGSITYAGSMALIYAQVPADDPRVRSALEWASKYWTLDENPGMGQQGVYFFYDILTRAVSAAGIDLVKRPDGTFLNWREPLARKVVSLQKIDEKTGMGYWVNTDGTYWENDPVLATSYALAALELL